MQTQPAAMAPSLSNGGGNIALGEQSHPTVESRRTREGRRLHYEMTVLQQPERARACGSGQKSASDRRPVDPPPVVQLRVLEGENYENAKDITFHYNANFFLYAGLELARPIAHGRVQTPAATSPPVLTGMPVSGMAYLDRPTEAGYFLFPDLSVRHEGRYRLQFHLYEEIKEDKDRSADTPAAEAGVDGAVDPSFDWRMEVKSVAFNVFSAKKFPGLSESTPLSRTVAEQGCRVRIRRDVRMRRRDGKPNGDFDNAEEEYSRPRRTQTPEPQHNDQYRARSSSNASEQRTVYAQEPQRRPSGVESYPPPPPPPSYGSTQQPSRHLRFGHDTPTAPYPPQYAPAPPAQQPPVSPVTPYHSNQPSPYQSAPPSAYPQQAPSGPQQYSQPQRESYDRRSSGAHVPPSPTHFAPQDNGFKRSIHEMPAAVDTRREPAYKANPMAISQLQSGPSGMADSARVILPPLGSIASGPKSATILPPLATFGHQARPDYIEPAPINTLSAPVEQPRIGGKRNFDDTFAENSRPQKDGQRQQDSHHAPAPMSRADHSFYHDDSAASGYLQYHRAAGHIAVRKENDFFP